MRSRAFAHFTSFVAQMPYFCLISLILTHTSLRFPLARLRLLTPCCLNYRVQGDMSHRNTGCIQSFVFLSLICGSMSVAFGDASSDLRSSSCFLSVALSLVKPFDISVNGMAKTSMTGLKKHMRMVNAVSAYITQRRTLYALYWISSCFKVFGRGSCGVLPADEGA